MKSVSATSSLPVNIIKTNNGEPQHVADMIAVEEPLEIRIVYGNSMERSQKSISVTMRTPGNDFELAAGFLFTEGIIKNHSDFISIKHCNRMNKNVVKVELQENVEIEIDKLGRNFYTSSSCGICGKSSIDAVKTVRHLPRNVSDDLVVSSKTIYSLPEVLRRSQGVFEFTGGLHGCGLFDAAGKLLLSREDVGRHNALDKLIGAALKQSMFPPTNSADILPAS